MERRIESQKSKKELIHNKLHRKLKRAIRRGEPYKHLLPSLDRLDNQLAQELSNWISHTYDKLLKVSNDKV